MDPAFDVPAALLVPQRQVLGFHGGEGRSGQQREEEAGVYLRHAKVKPDGSGRGFAERTAFVSCVKIFHRVENPLLPIPVFPKTIALGASGE